MKLEASNCGAPCQDLLPPCQEKKNLSSILDMLRQLVRCSTSKGQHALRKIKFAVTNTLVLSSLDCFSYTSLQV